MIPTDIIKKYYKEGSGLYDIMLEHGFSVADKALEIARIHSELIIDKTFVYEAAILHDIGIFKTYSPKIQCFGEYPYICHGYLGAEILYNEGLDRHALVCERHTGSGLTKKNIIENNIPVPERDMLPVSIEEKLICFADKFFSKSKLKKVKPVEQIRQGLLKYGEESLRRFDEMLKLFLG
ncbi:MAG: HDIG domain-containing protein [Dysgonamonadaceae bacterium]|jgi:uncharacterized protein|nr:HDIG domain-containing protein [Dysgonamonadaceae bacterium]